MIGKSQIEEYIKDYQVVFQMEDGLVEVCDGKDSPLYPSLRDALYETDTISVVSKNEMLNTSFHDLVMWSAESDALVLFESNCLVCIPKKDVKALNS